MIHSIYHRRLFPKRITLLFLCVILSLSSLKTVHAASNERPNIMLIMADDLGFSDLGCYGSEIKTPHLDQLAKEGLRFSRFYNAGRCCPTRASLMTGLYPHQAGMGWMNRNDNLPGYLGELNQHCVSIAEVLSAADYRCYHVGKWHLTYRMRKANENWPLGRGFDRAYGTGGGGNYFAPRPLYEDNQLIKPPKEGYYITDAFSRRAVNYLKDHAQQNQDTPFFMYLAYTAPHFPLHALPADIAAYRGRYRAGWDELRKQRHQKMTELGLINSPLSPRDPDAKAWDSLTKAEQEEWELRMAVYAAMVTSMDRGIGQVLEQIKQMGKTENTLVFFLSDNGASAEYIDRGHQPGAVTGTRESFRCAEVGWANASNTPFRFHKMWMHEGGISTPLIVRWPAQIQQTGGWTSQMGHVIDLMATCVDVSQATYPAVKQSRLVSPFEGKSLRTTFLNPEKTEDRTLYWEHEGNKAVRQGNWKLVKQHKQDWELYDLSQDRSELNNLAQQQPKRVASLEELWDAWAEHVGVVPWDRLPPPGYRSKGPAFYRKK
ncbi:arylsulfatase [Gimesia fumaroli]|uniref:Arylsulfatase n=1 Tax=Gimesia fumaroli TaxID=2527976 RepID=A0A518IER3_9PLAN|nr:arylsulfatase [Gimesia fumaroli]QDV51589.1 Arylsulfatase [Gimesia fumaroli]